MRGDLLQTDSESYDYDCFYSAADHFQPLKGPGRAVALPESPFLPQVSSTPTSACRAPSPP